MVLSLKGTRRPRCRGEGRAPYTWPQAQTLGSTPLGFYQVSWSTRSALDGHCSLVPCLLLTGLNVTRVLPLSSIAPPLLLDSPVALV